MHTIIVTLSILATLALVAYMFRDKLENFLPGWKAHITNGAIVVAGLAGTAVAALAGITPQDLINWGFDTQVAGAIVTTIGVVNMIISSVTKRAPAPVAPPTEYVV